MTPLAHCHLFTSGFYSERRIWFNEVIGQESVCSTGRCVSFLEKKSLEQALGPRFLTEARKLNSWNSFIDFLENYDSDPGSLDLETVVSTWKSKRLPGWARRSRQLWA
jgi:hypothetical protein